MLPTYFAHSPSFPPSRDIPSSPFSEDSQKRRTSSALREMYTAQGREGKAKTREGQRRRRGGSSVGHVCSHSKANPNYPQAMSLF